MNYQPFAVIAIGNMFHLVDKPTIRFLKCANDRAVLLDGYWEDGRLFSRGTLVPFKADTCIVGVTEGDVVLPAVKVDPIDPRRKFWQEGEFKRVGRDQTGKVNIFAGLFLYHGMGVGNYYSAAGNEIFWGAPNDGRERAAAEGIPFVYYDTFQWTNDPDLKRERAEAQRQFDDAKAVSLKTAVSANAEMA